MHTLAPDVPHLLTIERFARELDCSQRTVRRMIDRSELRAVRLGSKAIRIPRAELERLLASAATPAARAA